MRRTKIHSIRAAVSAAILLTGGAIVPAALAQHEGHSAPTATSRQAVEAPAEPRTVEIPIDKQRLMGVRTVVVAPRQIGKMIRTAGRVEYDDRKLATVNVKFEGWVEKLARLQHLPLLRPVERRA